MYILRRLPLSRLLLLCALVVGIGVSATALAFALGAGPTPPPKPLAQAIHDALAGASREPLEGVSANITWTDHLLEGANLASGEHSGELTSSPLVADASGRLWIAKDGRLRIELQSQQGDTQLLWDGHTLTVYDAATNTEYRYTPPKDEASADVALTPQQRGDAGDAKAVTKLLARFKRDHRVNGQLGVAQPEIQAAPDEHEVPSVAKIEEALAHLSQQSQVSGATPTDVGGQPAYTVRLSPKEGGSLFGGVELSFDANRGLPLRAAVYSSTSETPVLELAASEVSYGPVPSSVFELSPPADVKVQEIEFAHGSGQAHEGGQPADRPHVTTSGHGSTAIAVVASSRYGEAKEHGGKGSSQTLEGLPKVTIDGTSATELRTELGTILSFERGGASYLLGGFVAPAAVEAVARGL
jgi:outer membrane lipoprotein-sorting protein